MVKKIEKRLKKDWECSFQIVQKIEKRLKMCVVSQSKRLKKNWKKIGKKLKKNWKKIGSELEHLTAQQYQLSKLTLVEQRTSDTQHKYCKLPTWTSRFSGVVRLQWTTNVCISRCHELYFAVALTAKTVRTNPFELCWETMAAAAHNDSQTESVPARTRNTAFSGEPKRG